MKYIKHDETSTQSEISDELAELWVSNGNKDISDEPWPNLKLVPSYIVTDNPVEDDK